MKVLLQWTGEVETLIRTEVNGGKVAISSGEKMEVDKGLAEAYRASDSRFVITEPMFADPVPFADEPEVEHTPKMKRGKVATKKTIPE